MRVLVTGASGTIAAAVVPELLAAGHEVVGLARSDRSAEAVWSLGAEARRGDLDDVDGLTRAVQDVDGVVHLAFKNAEMRAGDLAGAVASDLAAIRALSAPLEGTGGPFVGTGATLGLVMAGFRGRLTEQDGLAGGPRIDAENTVLALADRGVRSAVVRLPPTVHGLGRYGFGSSLIGIARATGVAGYLGDGAHGWPSVDSRDVGALYRLALDGAPAGSRLHAVAEEHVTVRAVAEAIARRLDVPAASIAPGRAQEHFGFLAAFAGLDNPTSSRITRDTLGWTPSRLGLVADLAGT